ncbi:MAG: hypothetical protein AB1432_11630 [Bacteroidota bacterium]|jgi:hypothetical protein
MKFRVNKKEIVDLTIAALMVKNAPFVLGSFLPGSLTSGTTGNLLGGAFTYIAGMLLKKPLVSNAGLALAVSNVIQDVAIAPAVDMISPATPIENRIAARSGLREYVSIPRSSQNYARYYN